MYPENDFIPWGVQVHYCIYPQWAIAFGKLLGFLTVRYNMVPPPLLPRTYMRGQQIPCPRQWAVHLSLNSEF